MHSVCILIISLSGCFKIELILKVCMEEHSNFNTNISVKPNLKIVHN